MIAESVESFPNPSQFKALKKMTLALVTLKILESHRQDSIVLRALAKTLIAIILLLMSRIMMELGRDGVISIVIHTLKLVSALKIKSFTLGFSLNPNRCESFVMTSF